MSNNLEPIRIANIWHLAGAPYRLLSQIEGVIYEENTPTENARKLYKNEVDVALIPSMDFLLKGEYQSLEFGMGCRSRSDSMVLYANQSIENLEKIHVYRSSCSSTALLNVLFAEKWGTQPQFIRHNRLEFFDQLRDREGVLVLHKHPGSLKGGFAVREDLATCWRDHTGLPFVFLIWAVRPGVLRTKHLSVLNRWFHRCARHSKQLARDFAWSYGASENLSAEFVGDNRRYYLDDFLLGGLEEFLIRSQKQKMLPKVSYHTVRKNLFGEIVTSPRPVVAVQ
jgi:predicted solute-binding protein